MGCAPRHRRSPARTSTNVRDAAGGEDGPGKIGTLPGKRDPAATRNSTVDKPGCRQKLLSTITAVSPREYSPITPGTFPAIISAPNALTSIIVPAYVSSPELTFGFLFALESPERIADVVRGLMERRAVSVFRLARLSDDEGPPERYVVNWAAIPQISITTGAPADEELRAQRIMLVNAFLGEGGEVSMYAGNPDGPS